MDNNDFILNNAVAAPVAEIPVMDFERFVAWHRQKLTEGFRVCALFAVPYAAKAAVLYSLLACDKTGTLSMAGTRVQNAYPSLTPAIPAMHLFEREIYEQHQIMPQGHPWLKPVRFETPGAQAGVTDFFEIKGDEVHEVGVGPIHAGIIECGHFRFQCQGEVVMHLEISLGYHHRGMERACLGPLNNKTLALMETAAGDTSIGHGWAYCSNMESLAGITPPLRAQLIRAIALGLERLANHTGDLGALAGDIGYLPTASFCGRLRGDYLNLTAVMCGNRFGRNLLTPGGVKYDLTPEHITAMRQKLNAAARDTLGATGLLWKTDSVTARMIGRGVLPKETVLDLGIVGPPARAAGVNTDARSSFPLPHLTKHDMSLKTHNTGDIYARALIREKEIRESVAFIKRLLNQLPAGEILSGPPAANHGLAGNQLKLAANAISVALVEGWRGEICHIAMTNDKGEISAYKVIDPSFHNWIGLALAMRLQQISDFPLCNKSFNLSYCGHDL